MTTVSNSSPLIAFSAIGLLDALQSLYQTIHIPEEVYREVVIQGAGQPGAQAVAAASWIQRHTVTDQRAVRILMRTPGLNRGESEAIILARQLRASLIILDDDAARGYARAHHLPSIGTVGILLLAKAQGLTPAVKPPLDALLAFGFRISPAVYHAALHSAGE